MAASTGQETYSAHFEIGELDPLTQPKFVNPLPFPATLSDSYHEMILSQFRQGLGVYDPSTLSDPEQTEFTPFVWGYNGTYQGSTIEADKDIEVKVNWINNLPTGNVLEKHLFKIDPSVHWAGSIIGEEGYNVRSGSASAMIQKLFYKFTIFREK